MGSFEAPAGEEVFDPAVEQRLLTAGTRGDPAAQCRPLERLGEVAEGEPACGELALERRTADAGFEGRQAADVIQGQHPIQTAQVDRQHRTVPRAGVDVPDDACPAAVRNEVDVIARGEIEQAANVLVGSGIRHAVREGPDAAAAQGNPVRQTLAASVGQAGGCVRLDQRSGVETRRRERGEHLVVGCILDLRTGADFLLQVGETTIRQGVVDGRIAPTVPSAGA